MLYNLIITPIETIVDWTFSFFIKKFHMFGPAAAIVGVSLIINFLALPLYNIADSIQEKERKIQKSLENGVKRIKRCFKGDEQFMILQTYYKQNNYHPLYVLRSSLSILIEVPFFIAAYHYLSNSETLKGVSFLFFNDLGAPDRIFSFTIGTSVFYINILPILMTAINIVSGAVYAKEAPFREKIQIYVLAAVFLILLYNSPSGLVFYWILNNLFSLAKNVIKKMKNPGKVLHIIISGLFIIFTILFFIVRPESRLWKKLILIIFTAGITLIPYELKLLPILKNKLFSNFNIKTTETNDSRTTFLIFLLSAIGLAILCGLVLPSSVIASSPIEFSFLGKTENPLSYIYSSFCVFAGMFILWPLIIYKMFGKNVKKVLSKLFFVLYIISLFNAYLFKPNFGKLNVFFRFTDTFNLTNLSILFILLPFVLLLVCIFLYQILVTFGFKSTYKAILISIIIAEFTISILNLNTINNIYKRYKQNITNNTNSEYIKDTIKPFYHLSKTEKNVVVIFLDRAINVFFDRMINEFPELKDSYNGFIYYPNTMSFGTCTDTGSPAMMAGYEYTPYNINKRNDETLVKKHNEASLVLPKLFLDSGYDVFVTDPPFPNYEWKGDLSAFEAFTEINVAELSGRYSQKYAMEKGFDLQSDPDIKCRTNVRNFVVLEILFPILREFFYQNCYNEEKFDNKLIDELSVLYYLPQLTTFDSYKPVYTFIGNETTHNVACMNEPVYDRFIDLEKKDSFEKMQYHTNVAAFKTLANWLDYLKENKCYDNTRIIIVSDHAYYIGLEEFKDFSTKTKLAEELNCVLLFKDFDSHNPLTKDTKFMTNADNVLLATKDLENQNVNPFTGNIFKQDKNDGITVYERLDNPLDKTTTKFSIVKDEIYHVNGDIKNSDNWIKVKEE